MHSSGSFVFLANFFHKPARDQVLEFFVCAQAKHFFTTANGIAYFEVGENPFKKIIKAKDFFISENVAKLISDMIRKAT